MWVEELKPYHLTTHPADTVDPLLNDPRRRCLSDETLSPLKRQRTSGYSDLYPDPYETPTRPRPQLLRQEV